MILISHRGNTNGVFENYENEPNYIDLAITKGYDVEVDIWFKDNNLWLGHDKPQYGITLPFLLDRKDKLWIHTKNFDALNKLINYDLRIFYHEKENHTIINNCNLIWSHNLDEANNYSIIPLLNYQDMKLFTKYSYVYGICSDFIDCEI